MVEVFQKSRTDFENYMQEEIERSRGRGDFVGRTAVGPIKLLIPIRERPSHFRE